MKQRVITGFFFTIGVLLFIVPSLWWPIISVAFSVLVGGVAIYELYKAFKAGDMHPSLPLMITGGVIAPALAVAAYFLKWDITAALALYILITGLFCLASAVIPSIVHKEGEGHLRDGVITSSVILYCTFPLFCLMTGMLLVKNGWYYMVCGLFASWVSDVFAYFTGVTIGKHKIVPHISPKKTWEGCIGGSIFCAICVTVYCCLVIYRIDEIEIGIVPYAVLTFFLGLLISVMSQLGDWFCSVIKRRTGIKDFSNLFPGHGGMLDRFDSTFFTLPVALLLALMANNLY